MRKSNSPRRGEIWRANTGGKKHAVVIVSLDQRNAGEAEDKGDATLIWVHRLGKAILLPPNRDFSRS